MLSAVLLFFVNSIRRQSFKFEIEAVFSYIKQITLSIGYILLSDETPSTLFLPIVLPNCLLIIHKILTKLLL